MPECADQMAYLPKSVGDYLVERGWATLDRNSGVYYVARVRDAQGDDGETDRQRELRTGVANTTVENYRRGLEDVNEMVFAHCRRLGIPLMSPPRVAEALDALAEAAARSPQGEDHERVCLVCGLLDSEGGCGHSDDEKRPAVVARRSPQDEDHEAGIEAGIEARMAAFGAYESALNERATVTEAINRCADAAIAAYLSRVSPSRDGSVAVEDWRAVAIQLAALLRGLHPQNPYYREKQAEALAAFDALAGETNEGGNR